jgi:hypothetical protein
VQIDVPEPEAARSERPVDPTLGYREFELAETVVAQYRVERVIAS